MFTKKRITTTLLLISVLLLTILGFIIKEDDFIIEDFFLVVQYNDEIPKKLKTVYIKKGESLNIYPVFIINGDFYSEITVFKDDSEKEFKTKGIPKELTYEWIRIEPVLREYDNLRFNNPESTNSYIEEIEYTTQVLKNKNSYLVFNDIVSREKYGTYYFSLNINSFITNNFSSKEPLNEKYPNKTIQVVYRENDTYLGYLKELFNTPFIMAPRYTEMGYHQTDTRIGSDCAAFVTYGKRREGYSYFYLGPMNIYQYLIPVEKGNLYIKNEKGQFVYVTEENKKVIVREKGIEPGDIVHFGEQVSVFYQDQGIIGFLDKDDLLLQSYGKSPYVTSIKNSSFYSKPIRIYKWKDGDN